MGFGHAPLSAESFTSLQRGFMLVRMSLHSVLGISRAPLWRSCLPVLLLVLVLVTGCDLLQRAGYEEITVIHTPAMP